MFIAQLDRIFLCTQGFCERCVGKLSVVRGAFIADVRGAFHADVRGTFISDVRGTFISDVRGTFISDVRGTIAVMFALLSVPIMGAVFFAIDYSRATSHKSVLQNAADAAAVIAAQHLGKENSVVRLSFQAAFQANLPKKYEQQHYMISIAGDDSHLKVRMIGRTETTLIRAVGVPELTYKINAFAMRPDVELARRLQGRSAGSGGGGRSDGDFEKENIVRKIQESLEAARQAGLPVPGNFDAAELERMAEMILQQRGQ